MTQYARLNWQGRRLWTERGVAAAERGLALALQHLLAEAQRIVPLDKGPLERSGKVTQDGLNGAVSFDTVYAVRQHEELTWRHAPGRQAKYLETPMNTQREQMLRLMAVPLINWFNR